MKRKLRLQGDKMFLAGGGEDGDACAGVIKCQMLIS
jgi:hypothetical protein